MKPSTLIIALIISIQVLGQAHSNQKRSKINFLPEIKKYDISHLITLEHFFIEDSTFVVVRPQPLGFIGENFQRFQIRFISVIKNPSQPSEYFVYGKSKVKNNIYPFQGKITLKSSEVYDRVKFPNRTSEYRFLEDNLRAPKQGVVKGKYVFYQSPNQKGAGILKGNFTSNFFLDKENILEYDGIMWNADKYQNNQFKGQWISYKTDESRKCNWGDFRIPECGDLDVGDGEFSPNKKYRDFGWEDYQIPSNNITDKTKATEAKKKQRKKWWMEK